MAPYCVMFQMIHYLSAHLFLGLRLQPEHFCLGRCHLWSKQQIDHPLIFWLKLHATSGGSGHEDLVESQDPVGEVASRWEFHSEVVGSIPAQCIFSGEGRFRDLSFFSESRSNLKLSHGLITKC